jgi:hypothetical protein
MGHEMPHPLFYPTSTRGFEPPTYRLGVRPNFASHVIRSYQKFHVFELLDGPNSLQLSLFSSNPCPSHALVVAALLQSPKIQQNVKRLNKHHLSI